MLGFIFSASQTKHQLFIAAHHGNKFATAQKLILGTSIKILSFHCGSKHLIRLNYATQAGRLYIIRVAMRLFRGKLICT